MFEVYVEEYYDGYLYVDGFVGDGSGYYGCDDVVGDYLVVYYCVDEEG